jgi:PAS domain S-box-containing protein
MSDGLLTTVLAVLCAVTPLLIISYIRQRNVNRELSNAYVTIETRARFRESLVAFSQTAILGADIYSLMDAAAKEIRRALRSDFVGIFELDSSTQKLRMRAGEGWDEGTVGNIAVRLDSSSQAGFALLTNGAVVISDLAHEKRFTVPEYLKKHRVASGMSVILHGSRNPAGVISVHSRVLRAFTADEISYLEAISNLLSVAMERKRTESSLFASEQRFRLLAESVREYVIIMLDPTGHILSWNMGAERIKGYKAEEVLGRHFSIFYPQEDIDAGKLERELTIAKREGQYFEEGWRLRKGGVPFWASVVITAVFDEEGILRGFAKVTRDLTEKKKADDELRSLAERLEVTNKELEVSNKELEAFSYSVSHDLRSPLRAVDGYSRILDDDYAQTMSSDARSCIRKIRENSAEMTQLIEDLLSFSRMGRTEMRRTVIDMNQLVNETIQSMADELKGRSIEWKISKMPQVQADPAMLRLVLQNLFSNAIKYTRPRKHSSVSVEASSTDTEYVFSVHDNGVGFDMEYKSKLFGVFQRLHSNEEFEGTGIGLANVQRIVMRHGGRVWGESVTGKGASFYFTLPKVVREERLAPLQIQGSLVVADTESIQH